MSLLLDALKRAEEAKRAKLAGSGATPAEAAATSADSGAATRTVTPVNDDAGLSIDDYKEVIAPRERARGTQAPIELALETLPEERPVPSFSPAAPAATRQSNTPAARPQTRVANTPDTALSRETARSVFGAKQPAARPEEDGKKWLLPVIAVVLVVTGTGAWYVWNEVNRASRPTAVNVAARPTASLPPAQSATGQLPGAKVLDSTTRPVEPAEIPLPPLLPPPSVDLPVAMAAVRSGPALSEREALAKRLKEAPAPKDPPISLQLAKTFASPAINADLADAYAALKSVDYARARSLYARLIQADPLNIDAQLGMATALARRGEAAAAANHYRQVLMIDPRNGTALAGLMAVSDNKSPVREIELRTLLGRSPDSPSLQFTLGNLYASERRWVEAQQAYFEAYRLESGNADYVYNLAVSLDHLKQAKLAVDYYQKAILLFPKSGGQFDRAAVAQRVKELTGEPAIN